MPFNGAGVFQRVRNWVADATAGIKIRADYHDAEDDGFAAGLTNTITKDGQTIITQNIPFNSKRITGLADPINDQDAATKKYTETKFTAGGTLTGNMTISKNAPSLILDDTDAAGAGLFGQHAGKNRWLLRLGNDETESGSDVGSNFDLLSWHDDGSFNKQVMVVSRATGKATFNSAVQVNGDITAARSASVGAVYLGSDTTHYLFYSGTGYELPGSKLTLGAAGTSGKDAVTFDQLAAKQDALGFTPVRQGGGLYQGNSTVYLGWDGVGLRAQVDAMDLGRIAFGAGAIGNVRLLLAADQSIAAGGQGGMANTYEPFPGAVVTGWSWTNSGGFPYMNYFKMRWLQTYTDNWYTVGTA